MTVSVNEFLVLSVYLFTLGNWTRPSV